MTDEVFVDDLVQGWANFLSRGPYMARHTICIILNGNSIMPLNDTYLIVPTSN